MAYGYQMWSEESLTRVGACIAEVNGHAGVSRGPQNVNLLRNGIWLPFAWSVKIPDQSAMHWWGRKLLRVILGLQEIILK